MSETNKTYRIRTNINDNTSPTIALNINQDYDMFEILSLKISTENMYKLQTSKYGCVVGRVLANGGVGVPNAKLSIFIEADDETKADDILSYIYPYSSTSSKNVNNIRYNLLPNEKVSECHQNIGTFPSKRMVLDDSNVLEVFDKYYKFTTTTNESGDYMIFGVPVGEQMLHMDLDLSDIGFLSQKPIDMMYKGYTKTQFENSSQFKKDVNIDNLVQVISQNNSVYVYPFWGDNTAENVKITRCDIDVNYKFEPTCIFMGSMVIDDKSNGFSKNCIPSKKMGRMDRLTSGSGTIEMIRKRPDGLVEEFPVMGNELIDGNGTWCYQIPMNLDYVVSDEYGNLVPTDDINKGIPTRTRVRFRVSLNDTNSEYANNHTTKLLVPNNPQIEKNGVDYTFGSKTKDDDDNSSFRDLFWNNVYTVKSYIPRIQRGNRQRNDKFSGFKNVNVFNDRNPIPYNNMRVNITFMFTLQCAIIKSLIFFCKVYNWLIANIPGLGIWTKSERKCAYIGDGLCPDLEGWYFAPGCCSKKSWKKWAKAQMENTFKDINSKEEEDVNAINDNKSNDFKNRNSDEKICLTNQIDYFQQCVEINLAMENEVIQFDFYNDWINGLLYIPRWFVKLRKKRSYLFGLIKIKEKVSGCFESSFDNIRYLTQQCALTYTNESGSHVYNIVTTPKGCKNEKEQKCHRYKGRKHIQIFGKNGGLVHNEKNMRGLSVYYPKPCEWLNGVKCNLFATDIVLLGNINSCNIHGIPNDFDGLQSSTFQLPPNMVQTNMDGEGPIYGLNGTTLCSNTYVYGDQGKLQRGEQTFEVYQEYSKDREDYDPDGNPINEFAITEMVGIDWGMSGPNQRDNDNARLYQPGGHFLGIACSNSEVNIKSCVNLSRICEIGALMSQRQDRVKGIDAKTGKITYGYIVPTGLIGKEEISDSNYRKIFATLNHNNLKTIRDKQNNLLKYDFISMTPINFNGELTKIVEDDKQLYNSTAPINNKINNPVDNDERTITYENNSEDYYNFRMGIKPTEKEAKYSKKKYLRVSGNYVSMPVYENSYYFYFGIKDGNTAMDRFLADYYADCPSDDVIVEPSVTITDLPTYSLCDEIDKLIKFHVTNIPCPYNVTIINNTTNIRKRLDGDYYDYSEIEYDGVEEEGLYTIEVNNDRAGITITKDFSIFRDLGNNSDGKNNIGYNDIDIESEDYSYMPYYKFTYNDAEETYDKTLLNKDNISGGTITITIPKFDESKESPWVMGISIDDGEYFMVDMSSYGFNWKLEKSIKETFELDSNLKQIKLTSKEKNEVNGKAHITYYLWGNRTYSVKLLLAASYNIVTNNLNEYIDDYAKVDGINFTIAEVDINIKNIGFDLSFYDDSLTLGKLKALGYVNNDNSLKLYSALSGDSLSEKDKFYLKKTFLFNKSKYIAENPFEATIVPIGGTAPYTETLSGYGEYVNSDNTVICSENFYEDEPSANEDGYVLDLRNMYLPTEDFWNEYNKEREHIKPSGYTLKVKDKVSSGITLDNIHFYYAPFFFNALLWVDTKNDMYFTYAIANGITNENKTQYHLDDTRISINNKPFSDIKKYRENSENILTSGHTDSTKYNLTINPDKPVTLIKHVNGRTYDIEFNVTEHGGNSISVEHNCVFYNSIYIRNNKLRRDGISKYGARYYWIPKDTFWDYVFKTSSEENIPEKDDKTYPPIGVNNNENINEQPAWNSIHTYLLKKDDKDIKLAAYEITDHLDNPNNEKELPWNKDEYKDKNPLILGLYDDYTQLEGSYDGTNYSGEYGQELEIYGSHIPKDTSKLSFVRLYEVGGNATTTFKINTELTGVIITGSSSKEDEHGDYFVNSGEEWFGEFNLSDGYTAFSNIIVGNKGLYDSTNYWDPKDKRITITNVRDNYDIVVSATKESIPITIDTVGNVNLDKFALICNTPYGDSGINKFKIFDKKIDDGNGDETVYIPTTCSSLDYEIKVKDGPIKITISGVNEQGKKEEILSENNPNDDIGNVNIRGLNSINIELSEGNIEFASRSVDIISYDSVIPANKFTVEIFEVKENGSRERIYENKNVPSADTDANNAIKVTTGSYNSTLFSSKFAIVVQGAGAEDEFEFDHINSALFDELLNWEGNYFEGIINNWSINFTPIIVVKIKENE